MLNLWPYCRAYLFILGLFGFPVISYAYVVYDETDKMLNVNDIADFPRLNKMIVPNQKINCDSQKSACTGDVWLQVYVNEKAQKPLCGYRTKLINDGKQDSFLIKEVGKNNKVKKGWCKIEYYHGLQNFS